MTVTSRLWGQGGRRIAVPPSLDTSSVRGSGGSGDRVVCIKPYHITARLSHAMDLGCVAWRALRDHFETGENDWYLGEQRVLWNEKHKIGINPRKSGFG